MQLTSQMLYVYIGQMRGKFSRVQPLTNMNDSYVLTIILRFDVVNAYPMSFIISEYKYTEVTEHLCDAQAEICWFFRPV